MVHWPPFQALPDFWTGLELVGIAYLLAGLCTGLVYIPTFVRMVRTSFKDATRKQLVINIVLSVLAVSIFWPRIKFENLEKKK